MTDEIVCQVCPQGDVTVDDETGLDRTERRINAPVRMSVKSVSKARWRVITDDRCTCESVCQVCLQCDVVVDDR
jgi:hypothetical protein